MPNLLNLPSLFDISDLFSAFVAGALLVTISYEIRDRRLGKAWFFILTSLLLLNILMAIDPLWLKGA